MKKRIIICALAFCLCCICVLTIGLCCGKKTSALNENELNENNSIGYLDNCLYEEIYNSSTINYTITSNNATNLLTINTEELTFEENTLYCVDYHTIRFNNLRSVYIGLGYSYNNDNGPYIWDVRRMPVENLYKHLLYYIAYPVPFSDIWQRINVTAYRNTTDCSGAFECSIYKCTFSGGGSPVIDSAGNLIYNNTVYYSNENYIQYGNDKYNEGLETRQDINIKDYLLNSTFSTTFYSSNVHSPDNVIGYSITTITENDFINDKLQIYDIWVRNAIDSFGTNWLDTGQYYYYDNEILFDKVLDNNAISVVFVGNSSVFDNEPYIKYTDNTIKVLKTDNLNSIYVFFTENENVKYINTLGWSGYGEDYTGQYIYISIGGELYGLGYNEGLIEGNISGYNNGYGDGYEIGYNNGANDGYENGINASAGNTWSSIWDFIYNIFVFIGRFMDIEILPNIKIGYIVGIAIVFALFGFIINISK